MLGDVPPAREALDEALVAYREAQREVLALLEHDLPTMPLCSATCPSPATASATCCSPRARSAEALASLRGGLEIAEVLAPSAIQAMPAGSTTCPSASDRVGEALTRMGDMEAAFVCFRRGFAIAEGWRTSSRAGWSGCGTSRSSREGGRLGWHRDAAQGHERLEATSSDGAGRDKPAEAVSIT